MVSRIGHLVMHPVISRNSRNPVSFFAHRIRSVILDYLHLLFSELLPKSKCQIPNLVLHIRSIGIFDKIQHCFSVRRDAYFVVNLSERYFSEKEFMDRIANIPCVNHTEPLLANKKSVSGDHSFFPIIRQSAKPTFNGRGIKEAFSFFKSLLNDILASRTVRDSVYFQIQTIQINFLCVMLFVCFLVLRKRKMVLFFPCRNRSDSVRHGLFRAIIAEKKMDNLRIPHRTRINRRLPLASRNPYYQAPEIYRTIP